jgi:hypothetical protein
MRAIEQERAEGERSRRRRSVPKTHHAKRAAECEAAKMNACDAALSDIRFRDQSRNDRDAEAEFDRAHDPFARRQR